MAVLGLLLVGFLTFSLGICVWAVASHFLTAEVPPTLQHRVKFRVMHCSLTFLVTWGLILEKLRICSMPKFIRCVHDLVRIKEDPTLVVTNMNFGTIPVRLFQPKAMSSSPRRGIIFFHGGGGMFGSLDSYHGVCSFLARETDSVVLSVGYRKLPDCHYPTFSKDCLHASIRFLKTLKLYEVDPSRVVICGESVGGWAAALVLQDLINIPSLPQIRAQVLIYPILQTINFLLPSHQKNQNVPFLPTDFMMTYLCNYLTVDRSWKDAMLKGTWIPPDFWQKYKKWLGSDNLPQRFRSQITSQSEFLGPFNETAYMEIRHVLSTELTPLLAEDETIARLPQAFLVSCQYDSLRDDVLLYKKRLEDQGVPVSWYHVEDGFHGCFAIFDRQSLSFPCSLDTANAVVSYIKEI